MRIIILLITAVVMSAIGFLLLVRDKKQYLTEKESKSENENIFSKGMLVYSAVIFVITAFAAAVFAVFYIDLTIINGVKYLTLLSILWPVAYIDYRVYRIPNSYIVMGFVGRIVLCFFELFTVEFVGMSLLADLIAAAALLLAALLCSVCIKNSIGFGDIKLFAVMGLFLGLERIWGAIFTSLIISFVIALTLLIIGKKSRKDVIPFGPALAIGTYLSLLLNVM